MEFLIEFLLTIILEPIITLLVEIPAEQVGDVLKNPDIPKWRRALIILLIILIMTAFLAMLAGIIVGPIVLATAKTSDEETGGILLLSIGLGLLAVFGVLIPVRVLLKKKRKRKSAYKQTAKTAPDKTALRRLVHVVVDRPLGSVHPEHPDIVYGVNYGYVPDVMGGDGEAQDAYILGVDEPISEFDGVVVGIIKRLNDNEDKWVVAPREYDATDEEIMEKTAFQEKFFEIELIRH